MRADKPEDYYNYLLDAGKLKTGNEFYFYYYAIKDGVVYSHHFDISRAGHLRIYTNQIYKTGTYEVESFICDIESNELISKKDLVTRLETIGYKTSEDNHRADFYYLMKVKVTNDTAGKNRLIISDVNSVNGNDSFSPHSPKVLPFKFVKKTSNDLDMY